MKEKEIKDLFFKFAYCEKCRMKADYCNCPKGVISKPIMMLAQFTFAMRSLNNKNKMEKQK
jgi:hypothetical protein